MSELNASLSEWKQFLESSVYQDIKAEIQARKDIITPRLVQGNDEVWTDDNMRGRLNELEFIDTLVEDVIQSIEMEESKEEPTGSTFMNRLFETFKKGV